MSPRFFVSIVGQFFGTWFFADGFLFSITELGLLTNTGHRVRVLYALGSYMYILYCKQCITMNEYRIFWFSQFGFPGEKSPCNVCI
jgi:hypothetical protein